MKTTTASIPPDQPILPLVAVAIAPLALRLEDAAKVAGTPSWTLREAIMTGRLRAKAAGRSHVVLIADLRKWLASLEDVEPSTAPSILARAAARKND